MNILEKGMEWKEYQLPFIQFGYWWNVTCIGKFGNHLRKRRLLDNEFLKKININILDGLQIASDIEGTIIQSKNNNFAGST